jgi:molybdopterin converting factor small subunit
MVQVKLKVHSSLSLGLDTHPDKFEEILISIAKGESVLDVAGRLANESGMFREVIFDERNQKIRMNIIVILNGRIISPYDHSEATLNDGDEVMFLPIVDGG